MKSLPVLAEMSSAAVALSSSLPSSQSFCGVRRRRRRISSHRSVSISSEGVCSLSRTSSCETLTLSSPCCHDDVDPGRDGRFNEGEPDGETANSKMFIMGCSGTDTEDEDREGGPSEKSSQENVPNHKMLQQLPESERCEQLPSSSLLYSASRGSGGAGLISSDVIDEKLYQRSLNDCRRFLEQGECEKLSNTEVLLLVSNKILPLYRLESALADCDRAVLVRRLFIKSQLERLLPPGGTDSPLQAAAIDKLPHLNYDFKDVNGACCENVVGYMPVPLGVAGPLLIDGSEYFLPLATTEGCLVASTNRGCRALTASGGVRTCLLSDGMTRAPVVELPNATRATRLKHWIEDGSNFEEIASSFNVSSRFCKLKSIKVVQVGRLLYIRFVAFTGDAMGMNMVSKGSEQALEHLQRYFPDIRVISLSGNFCSDKKPSAVNWLEGRGKSVVAEAYIPEHVVQQLLKTSIDQLVELNVKKNLIGSAVAASIGGFNAHAANIVSAFFIATGQDPAQVLSSSNCITFMERQNGATAAFDLDNHPTGRVDRRIGEGSGDGDGGSHDSEPLLYVSCTMPSLEVATVGGGTILGPQQAALQMLGLGSLLPSLSTSSSSNLNSCLTITAAASSSSSSSPSTTTPPPPPGQKSSTLARIICSTVLAAELSLLSTLSTGHLVRSHLRYNRSAASIALSSQYGANGGGGGGGGRGGNDDSVANCHLSATFSCNKQ